MKRIENQELYNIEGGFSLTAAFVNALVSVGNTIMEAGRNLGSGIRRLYSGNLCSCK